MKAKDSREKIKEWIEEHGFFQPEDFTLIDLMAIGYEIGYSDGAEQGRKPKEEPVFRRKEMI